LFKKLEEFAWTQRGYVNGNFHRIRNEVNNHWQQKLPEKQQAANKAVEIEMMNIDFLKDE